ncbi:putative TIR domain, P-loop containing nucleoside triphosphate hydrolase [Rosa chinensis]|uniref:ADP-ribosyl cyclase/cyclic ADP-ribose hydrolase n=2 Tax=Rosa chinensis TaxID=74649 RepID=A0A2P6PUG3_ROSCH|nr:TMV resistance protein N isoform X1 [Rosa chinensis]XP_024164184.1 TMV resistance protein N isoform X1 [Rosa chinensis]XP_024164185.1 TMV resistance protein N isoform X1 [Rosa chinensis]PRQ25526.1 putative TIR domain, P-loop containing nucleoside triphosphate hydrolase [Rosa chinensis]
MSIQRISTSFPHSTPQWKYDVFLSFRGDDTRKAFTDHLYTALEHQGIITFRDDPELQKGEAISLALFAAIEESRFALIVISQNYASSTWCLDELVRILECMEVKGTVLPIFYDVDPSDLRKQTGSFKRAFANHEERFKDDKEKVQRWRSALTEVASFSGWNSKEWYESQLIRDIVEVIWRRLQPRSFSYAENLVGIYSRLQPVNVLLDVGVDDVRFVGIWGMGGIGKTTMVKAVYERISCEFQFSFLLTDVRNSVEKSGLLNLQKQLLSGIWTKEANISDLHEGAMIIRRLLGDKRVLLILDDVNHPSHLEYLAGDPGWFGSGSRVLITTRNEHLLIGHGVERRLRVNELNDADSLELFSRKAFKRVYPEKDFLALSISVINYAKGLPLALKVLGSFLYGRDLSEWDSTLGKLGRVCKLEIFDVLKISYEDLDSEEKKIFLDIACFFNGQDKDRVTKALASCDFAAIIGIKVLIERSLLNLSDGRLWMHDLLREMGHEIIRLESPNEPGRCSRLWLLEDVKHVLTQNTGTEAIEGILVDSTELGVGVDVAPKSFLMMNKLRYLKIKNGNLPKGLDYLPNSLRILDWTRYPLKSLPSHFNPQKLQELSLSHSCIKHFRIGTQHLHNLKTINLSHSVNLVNIPNFKGMPYLEFLFLEGCIRLYEVDPGIGVLERLAVLNLKDCENLVRLPSNVGGLKYLKYLNLSGCSKLDKLPDELGHVVSLEKLDVSGSGIRELPSSIGLLKNLKVFSVAGCKAASSKSGNMMFNPFQLLQKRSHIPVGLSLACLSGLHSLTELGLSDCNLSELPSDFGCLSSLRDLYLSRNHFIRLPESIGQLPRLGGLDLACCGRLRTLPMLPSRLKALQLNWCGKLRTLPELPSQIIVSADNCNSLETLANQMGQCNSVQSGYFVNCFKMVEKGSCQSMALPWLTRYLKSEASSDRTMQFGAKRKFDFVAPGNEIPEWYNHQSVGSSITVELHPGWFSNKFMGFASCIVFRVLKPLTPLVEWSINCNLRANGKDISNKGPRFGGKWGQPVLDHIWLLYVPCDGDCFNNEWQDIYYHLILSFNTDSDEDTDSGEDTDLEEEIVQVKKCGIRMVYEEDVEELWETLLKQSNIGINTKQCLQYDDEDEASSSASQALQKRIKQRPLDSAEPSGTPYIHDQKHG